MLCSFSASVLALQLFTWGTQFTSAADVPVCMGQQATIYVDIDQNLIVGGPDNGQPYDHILRGTSGNDVIVDSSGLVLVESGDGSDIICTGSGTPTIHTGNGNNQIETLYGDSTITTGNGNNTIHTLDGTQTITTGDGNDSITVGHGSSTIHAGNGSNSITTGNGNETIVTQGGNDIITTGNGNSDIQAGDGDNIIHAGIYNDHITVGNGNSTIDANDGYDTCLTGSGNMTVTGCENINGVEQIPSSSSSSSSDSSVSSSSSDSSSSDSSSSSSDGSSSSSSSEGTGSSSSEASSSAAASSAAPVDFANRNLDQTSSPENGGHLGHQTNVILANLQAMVMAARGQIPNGFTVTLNQPTGSNVILASSTVAPAAFGGGKVPTLLDAANTQKVVCDAQKMLRAQDDRLAAASWTAVLLQQLLGIQDDKMASNLVNTTYCQSALQAKGTSSLLAQADATDIPAAQKADINDPTIEKYIPLDQWGVPTADVSINPENETFNACIRGYLAFHYDQYGRRTQPKNCRRYSDGGYKWEFPADSIQTSTKQPLLQPAGVQIMWNSKYHILSLPKGFKTVAVTSNQ